MIASGKKIRTLAGLIRKYGGKARDWKKKSSKVMTKNGRRYEIHWYEKKGGERFQEKIKWLDPP